MGTEKLNHSKHREVCEALCGLLGGYLCGEQKDSGIFAGWDEWQWDDFFFVAMQQGVAALALDAIGGLPQVEMPYEVYLKFLSVRQMAEDEYHRHLQVLSELISYGVELGIPTMVLKGLGMSRYYPNPDHRKCGDIDIYQFGRGEDFDSKMSKMQKVEVRAFEVGHHNTYKYKGILIENHTSFLTIYRNRRNQELELLLESWANDRQEVAFGGEIGYVPAAAFQAVYLICHAATHFKEDRVSMKQLCDWLVFVNLDRDKVDWGRVLGVLRDFHLDMFYLLINVFLKKYCGLPISDSYGEIEENMVGDFFDDVFREEPISKGSIIEAIKHEYAQYVKRGWKFRLLGQVGCVELLKKIGLFMLHPQDFKNKVVMR